MHFHIMQSSIQYIRKYDHEVVLPNNAIALTCEPETYSELASSKIRFCGVSSLLWFSKNCLNSKNIRKT